MSDRARLAIFGVGLTLAVVSAGVATVAYGIQIVGRAIDDCAV